MTRGRMDVELISHLKQDGWDVTPSKTIGKRRSSHEYSLRARLGSEAVKHYKEQLEKQNEKCAICGQLPTAQELSLDHDHASSQLRGLLCSNCNTLLGFAHDNILVLAKAVTYLLEWNPALKQILEHLKKAV